MALEIEEVVLSRLSVVRLHSYLSAVGGDLSNALRLYQWNVQISAALFEVLAVVEIVVRNSLHQQFQVAMQKRTGSTDWFAKSHDLLNFGFWRFLFAKQYRTTLWPLAGKYAFPNLEPSQINELSRVMGRLHDLRNRIAHHEPIHTRDIGKDLADCLWVIGGICMTTRDWTMKHSRVTHVLERRPLAK